MDGIVNYVMGVSFDDPFRFTLVQLEEEERKTHNQVVSGIVVWLLKDLVDILYFIRFLMNNSKSIFYKIKMSEYFILPSGCFSD